MSRLASYIINANLPPRFKRQVLKRLRQEFEQHPHCISDGWDADNLDFALVWHNTSAPRFWGWAHVMFQIAHGDAFYKRRIKMKSYNRYYEGARIA